MGETGLRLPPLPRSRPPSSGPRSFAAAPWRGAGPLPPSGRLRERWLKNPCGRRRRSVRTQAQPAGRARCPVRCGRCRENRSGCRMASSLPRGLGGAGLIKFLSSAIVHSWRLPRPQEHPRSVALMAKGFVRPDPRDTPAQQVDGRRPELPRNAKHRTNPRAAETLVIRKAVSEWHGAVSGADGFGVTGPGRRHRQNHSNPRAVGILTRSAATAVGTNPAGSPGGAVVRRRIASPRSLPGERLRWRRAGRGGTIRAGCGGYQRHRMEGT